MVLNTIVYSKFCNFFWPKTILKKSNRKYSNCVDLNEGTNMCRFSGRFGQQETKIFVESETATLKICKKVCITNSMISSWTRFS